MTRSAAPDLKAILRPVDGDLSRVTDRLLESLQHPIARMSVYLITAGGKRLRPALTLLAGRSGDGRTREALVDLAAAIELVHTATLIHDDIVDGSRMRRKQQTFHQRFGTERAVLMGDYLYSVAFAMFAKLEDPYVTRYMAEICQQLSRGEITEVETRYNLDVTEAEHLSIVRDKTASLIAACGHLGSTLAGAKADTVARITEFGWNVGMAFQIMDDCLDLMGEARVVGKTVRADLEQGSLSLPIIYLAHDLPRRQRDRLFAPLRRRRVDASCVARIAHEARRSGAVARALQRARDFVQDADASVAQRDGVALVSTYHQLARYAVERVR